MCTLDRFKKYIQKCFYKKEYMVTRNLLSFLLSIFWGLCFDKKKKSHSTWNIFDLDQNLSILSKAFQSSLNMHILKETSFSCVLKNSEMVWSPYKMTILQTQACNNRCCHYKQCERGIKNEPGKHTKAVKAIKCLNVDR